MSPASRSKSKDKKAGKEPPKGSSKSSGHINTSSGIPASGYNPLLGTFHTFDTPPVPTASALQINTRFRNIDDTDDQNGIEYDSVSNNESWSGDSEDPKEKASQQAARQESVPGADNDKREKIRQKNERKHQRQKERRAQELHERCSGYLMSRKLEALAQKLVSMGFSQERAMMALILNEGRVEESVSWLFEVGEEDKRMEHNLDGEGALKIDISDELARISDMEIRHKASKQEVERAIVACEGDIEKAEEMLKAQKQEPSKPEETGDPPTVANGKLPVVATAQNSMRLQTRSAILLQRRDEKDFNYTKTAGPCLDPGTKSMKKLPPKSEWAKPQPIPVPVSCSLASPSPPPAKVEARYLAIGNEVKNLQLGSVREPVIVMQRPQSANAKQAPSSSVSSSPPGPALGWYPNSIDTGKPNGPVPSIAITRSISPGGVSSNLLYNQHSYQSQQPLFVQSSSSSSAIDSRGNGLWSRGGASPTLSAASSLGLFSGLGGNGYGSSGSSSPVDWSTGSMQQLDYTNIDWSLDRGGSLSSRPGGSWGGGLLNNGRTYESFGYGGGMRPAMGPILSNGNQGLQEGVASAGGGGSWEWTSPFEERDIFSLPRQFVSSPSL